MGPEKWVRHFGVAPVLRGTLIPAVIGVHEEGWWGGKHVESKSRVEQYACRPKLPGDACRSSDQRRADGNSGGAMRRKSCTPKALNPPGSTWGAGTFQVGVSTQSDVMAALRPPRESLPVKTEKFSITSTREAVGTGVIFIVYNQVQLTTRYDRAIFSSILRASCRTTRSANHRRT